MNWYQKIVSKIGLDKIAHFFVSAFLTLALGHFFHPAVAAAVTLALGSLKEVLDGKIDWKDLLADGLGTLTGILVLIV